MINKYNTTITLYRRSNTGTNFRPVWSWSEVSTYMARLSQLSQRDMIRNEGNTVVADYICFLDYTEILNTDRVLCGSDIYEIYSVENPDYMNHHLELMLKKLPAGAWEEMDSDSSDI